jgi:hypothetical protein
MSDIRTDTLLAALPLAAVAAALLFTKPSTSFLFGLSVFGAFASVIGIGLVLAELAVVSLGFMVYLIVYLVNFFGFVSYASALFGSVNPKKGFTDAFYLSAMNFLGVSGSMGVQTIVSIALSLLIIAKIIKAI